MKLYSPKELTGTSGDMILLYGESGVGKSVTSIQTSPDPIVYIMAEGRDVLKMLTAAQRHDVKIKFGFYSTWDDLMDVVTHPENFVGARTIIIDSLTHIMSICLSDEIMEESYDAADKKKTEKELTMRVKMSLEGYGTLGGQMLRLTSALTKLSQQGHVVTCIARVEQNPKFNRALSAAPALKGKEYSKYFQGFFDFIGYIEPRVEDGMVIYPPLVSFQDDGSYMSKWTGLMPKGGVYRRVCNIEKILKVAHGETVNGNGKGEEDVKIKEEGGGE
jgi:hypothetical protein